MPSINRYRRVVPATFVDITGTPTGDISDIQIWQDGNQLQVTETNGTPGLRFTFTFVGVTSILRLFVMGYYNGSATHHLDIQMWNYTTSAWDQFCAMMTANDSQQFVCEVFDDTDYISGGASQVRFDHHVAGNNSHNVYLDYIALLY